jgi:hypothetical protein
VKQALNRNQRRRLNVETKQENKSVNEGTEWFKQLPPKRKMFIGYMIEQGVIKNDNTTAAILDDCFFSAMEDLTDIDYDSIVKIIDRANFYIFDCKEYLNRKGVTYMNKRQELMGQAKVMAKAIINDDPKKNNLDIIRIMENDVDLPKKDLNAAISNARKEIKDLQKEQLLNEFGQENEKILNEVSAGEEIPVKEISIPSKLKIKNIVQEIEGQYNTYLKSAEGVKIGDKLYNDKSIVEEEKNAYLRHMEDKEQEIKQTIENLKQNLDERIKMKNAELEKFEELEEVFKI